MKLYGQSWPGWLPGLAIFLTPLLALAWPWLALQGQVPMLSERGLVRAYQSLGAPRDEALVYLDYRPVSASFYSRGKAGLRNRDRSGLEGSVLWLAVHRSDGHVPDWNCKLHRSFATGLFDLYRCTP
ncbi:MAG: hypothetical protein R3348_04465 [Xanthomonadales bacterium]|nr:hypothetical protein [Xanthomonadales bacterium]